MADNFANNAFTDFAPLLTLFGDEVTKQYLATSMSIADNILLGIAPIGLMTIIVSSIRVGGNRFMKSIVGRARDSPDDEEKEMLSSTSATVREIWDGNRIVRQTGPSKTTQLVFGPSAQQSSHPLRRCEDDELYVWDLKPFRKISRDTPSERLLDVSSSMSPSLTLNIEKAIPDERFVLFFACIGVLVQTSAMVLNAVIVYYWQWKRGANTVASYGYPTWASGTVCIAIGASICGWVLESSTWKFATLPSYNKHPLEFGQIVLLQKRLPDQRIPGYVIRPVKPGEYFKASQRRWPLVGGSAEESASESEGEQREKDRRIREISTIVGATVALSGFILQNIGTRELHFSAGLIQLGVTLFQQGSFNSV
ncbi:hypothetical protein QBC47DRAFT_445709 [Echria macrotheca]|uniref:Uncharacterized protein n=1 Tax=Echria macrotheca TaxID=438768 RepID=A0AAJ0BCX4_9PEZI|nr:hypothetical protein QBC47DRAFT_445709 [Echria macrotheca]